MWGWRHIRSVIMRSVMTVNQDTASWFETRMLHPDTSEDRKPGPWLIKRRRVLYIYPVTAPFLGTLTMHDAVIVCGPTVQCVLTILLFYLGGWSWFVEWTLWVHNAMPRMRRMVNVHNSGVHRNVNIMVQWSITCQMFLVEISQGNQPLHPSRHSNMFE